MVLPFSFERMALGTIIGVIGVEIFYPKKILEMMTIKKIIALHF
jgi:hypothetical protein